VAPPVVLGEACRRARVAAERLVADVPIVESVVWPDVAHLPSLERPADFERLVLAFVAGLR
jgi:pimeloyl-ACP methyl ester carboxylesterase